MWVVGESVISKLEFLQRHLVGDSERISRGGRLRGPPILV